MSLTALAGLRQALASKLERMCGIVGYVGSGPAAEVLIGGLRRLEYRGYDSAGIAVIEPDGELDVRKRAGKLARLEQELERNPVGAGSTGIGHTRWATHGGPTDVNAHPHLGDGGRLAVIHNGIIENFAELRAELEADGEVFASETDTEAAALLLGREFRRSGDLREAFRTTVRRLRGQFTLLAVHRDEPGVVVAARHISPLVIGIGDGEMFLGSDVAAFVEHTKRAIAIDDDTVVAITAEGYELSSVDGGVLKAQPYEIDWDASAADKGGWSSFMAKELTESGEAVRNTLLGRAVDGSVVLPELDGLSEQRFAGIRRIVILACGTAYYAGLVAKYAIERWARLPVDVEQSHEFRYRDPVVGEDVLVLSISQSGETIDTLMAVRYARARGACAVSVCNTQGATIPRESDAAVYTHAGPEVAVASTKAFVAQIAALYLIALRIGAERGTLAPQEIATELRHLGAVPAQIERALEGAREKIAQLAHWMADTRSVLFLGRHVGYPIALEGALKLKELAYIHAEGFAAGELKHGPIALIDAGQPVFVVVPSPRDSTELHDKVVSNIQEVRARGARVIALAEEGDASVLPYSDEVIRLPLATPFYEPMLAVVPLQLFALELASAKGLDVDQPRNLAKSVTVE